MQKDGPQVVQLSEVLNSAAEANQHPLGRHDPDPMVKQSVVYVQTIGSHYGE